MHTDQIEFKLHQNSDLESFFIQIPYSHNLLMI